MSARKVLLAAVAAVAAAWLAGAGQPSSLRVSPTAVAFRDPGHGLLGGLGGAVYATSDGGTTWQLVRRLPGSVTHLELTDRDAWAIVCGSHAGCDRGLLFHSRDGGRAWQPTSGLLLHSFAFADSLHGLATVADARLVATTDGGRSWRRARTPCTGGLAWDGAVSFPAPRRAWALCSGQSGTGQQPKGVYRSLDGGSTWKAVSEFRCDVGTRCRVRGSIGGYGYAFAISMSAGGRGVIAETRGTLLLTRDGGRTWRAPAVSQPEIDFGVDAQQVSEEVVIALLERGGGNVRLVASADGGRTWRTLHRWR